MSRSDVRKVLVVQLGPLAEFVAALASMERIRAAHPHAKITLLTIPRFESLARACPYINNVDNEGAPVGLGEWMRLNKRLKGFAYDRIYDLQWGKQPGLLPPPWPGKRTRLAGEEHMHPLERGAATLEALGVWPGAPTQPGTAPPPDLSWILKRSGARPPPSAPLNAKPFVLLAPGGLAKRPGRRWPVEHFAQFALEMRKRGYDIVIVGRPDESALARTIQRSVQARDLTGGSDFAQIATLGARATLAVGGDTGVTHLIAAAGAPTIALLPSDRDPLVDGPRGHVTVAQAADLANLSVETVVRAADSLLPQRA